MGSVLLSASVERFSVFCMQDFLKVVGNTTKNNNKNIWVLCWQMFHNFICCLQYFQNIINLFEIFSLYMTMILILCDYPCGKEVSENVHSGKVPDSANESSNKTAGSSLIGCEALGRPAWNTHSKEQRCYQPLIPFFNPFRWPVHALFLPHSQL